MSTGVAIVRWKLGAGIIDWMAERFDRTLVITDLGFTANTDVIAKRDQVEMLDSASTDWKQALPNDVEIIVACHNGFTLDADLLSRAKLGALNVHTSLLPSHATINAVASAIRSKDRSIGLTIHRCLPDSLVVGPLLFQCSFPLVEHQRLEEISEAFIPVAKTGLDLSMKMLRNGADGMSLQPSVQYRKRSFRMDNIRLSMTVAEARGALG